MTFISKTQHADVVLIGGGIMSATLGAFIKQLEPTWTISLFERLDEAGLESSGPWNNAGTGHAALCELNYSPAAKDGSVDPSKALHINEQFQLSRQFWSHLVDSKVIGSPKGFINTVPHMSFVIGDDHANFLKTRYEALKPNTLFRSMEYTEDQDQIAKWAPLIVKGRDRKQRVAATRAAEGTDVDFGALTRELTDYLQGSGAEVNYGHDVTNIHRAAGGGWDLSIKHPKSGEHGRIHAKFVFVGAGGGALHLLQASGIPESKGYGGFPVSGQFFRCTDDAITSQHSAKVYGQASVGAPPMSVPHLDTRYVDGKRSLLFGPYAGFSTNFLKTSSYLDLPLSIRPGNIIPMLAVAKDNMDLTAYLIKEVAKRHEAKVEALREYYPEASGGNWELITAGQRVQIIKKHPQKGGVLQFGTEVIASRDGSIGALLGASPGASTAVPIMIELLQKSFPKNFKGWQSKLKDMMPGYGVKLNENPDLAAELEASTARSLQLDVANAVQG
ncbi:malate:quinone oxidoreductase [Paenarthrobacter aurescens]|uniref:Probable malate:quinone oxidoreductase n=1 Tax=Paenarthrobacter aurescens TaxID=43663 RepID=A0A4Y3N9A6_PAEAU|nr:malate:quinone oxidoreductase [Paenarthrobacter aurescens]UKA48355.1 malate:quinone oxidoreductase [Arthrobacter sp. FW305-123]MDO6143943.1 malate:quinone oxidoreductase [Paenarthrobacter aurescens]MDO6147790.1 malate:quinone oxidoreductase [Paenarthrobacter aurescens]MDO6159034.1 malate:quinone oxidoreductase [Paenarthrobacter aurescens]MDO6163018.1 malate:quinone oxidoreductase [Paenarthrobacter aurescens]